MMVVEAFLLGIRGGDKFRGEGSSDVLERQISPVSYFFGSRPRR